MPKTVALRFRDFGVDTIAEHNAVVAANGQVWWGWWNKPDEKTPRAVLGAFQNEIDEHGFLQIFLVDSGGERLFSARLGAIAVDPLTESPADPTDRQLVPGYYRERPFKVWFRFDSEIELHPSETITGFSYDEVPPDQFVLDASSDAFDNKRVWSLREMLDRRHRTMYFLRPAVAEDSTHEVRLDAPPAPAPFQPRIFESDSNYLAFFSDLHLSEDHHAFALEPAAGNPDLVTVLDDDVRTGLSDVRPAAVVLSGDLTWRANTSEFELARQFVSKLRSAWDLSLEHQVLAIPGNHDITHVEADPDTPLIDAPEPGQVADEGAEAAYRAFVSQALKFNANSFMSMGRRILLANGVPVDVLALNSCRLEQAAYAGYGFVGRDQVIAAFSEMGWRVGGESGPRLRVLVLHHHVLPVVPLERLGADRYSLTLDAGELLHVALEYGVDLIVHGHQHQPFVGTFSRAVPGSPYSPRRRVVAHGAGSIGVAGHLGPIGRNAYSLVHVTDREVAIVVRARSEQHGHSFSDLWKVRFERTIHGLTPVEVVDT